MRFTAKDAKIAMKNYHSRISRSTYRTLAEPVAHKNSRETVAALARPVAHKNSRETAAALAEPVANKKEKSIE